MYQVVLLGFQGKVGTLELNILLTALRLFKKVFIIIYVIRILISENDFLSQIRSVSAHVHTHFLPLL